MAPVYDCMDVQATTWVQPLAHIDATHPSLLHGQCLSVIIPLPGHDHSGELHPPPPGVLPLAAADRRNTNTLTRYMHVVKQSC